MDSLEKIKLLMKLDKKGAKLKIVTIKDEEIICKLSCFSEDEEDFAYDVITFDNPPQYLTVECSYIKSIEEIPA